MLSRFISLALNPDSPPAPAASRLSLEGRHIHLVGIKGTGMCALAELLLDAGAVLEGSDTSEVFYTDAILRELGIPFAEGFEKARLSPCCGLVIHSAAYDPSSNPVLAQAKERGIACIKYTEALGAFSAMHSSAAIAGVHGKTTTTALAGVIARALGLPARILVGSAVADFDGRSTLSLGDEFFIAETCEYRRHFMSFRPKLILLTSVEPDHQDFFPTYESIRDAFVDFALRLPDGGTLIYCADDPGATEVAGMVAQKRKDIRLIPYGLTAVGPWKITALETLNERTVFRLEAYPSDDFVLRVPGWHTALDAAGALALMASLGASSLDGANIEEVKGSLEAFRGSKRRSEIVGEAAGVLVMDDYAHHPHAIMTTLEGYRSFYPARRLVVSFMSHTYTRTAALLDEFARSLSLADVVILHKIYASAREKYTGGVNGRTLAETAARYHRDVRYYEEVLDPLEELTADLKPGDLFVSMGAGDNWRLGVELLKKLKEKEERQ